MATPPPRIFHFLGTSCTHLNCSHKAECRGEEVKVENAEEQGRGGGYPGPGQQAVQAGEQQEGGEGRTPTVHVKRK